jgi:hypothetical protein
LRISLDSKLHNYILFLQENNNSPGTGSIARPNQLDFVDYLFSFRKWVKFFRIWWTRTQRIRTEAELRFDAILADAAAAPLYQRIAGKAFDLHQLGLGSTTIARRLSTTRKTVVKALAWLTGRRQVE